MNAIETLGLAAVGVVLGDWLADRVPLLVRFHIPGAVIGGGVMALSVAMLELIFGKIGWDTTFQTPLMVAFFAAVGWTTSLQTLWRGGRVLFEFFSLTVLAMAVQTFLGLWGAGVFGLHPLMGVITGPAALAGGPGTALAFGPLFDRAGVIGASEAGLVVALCGILCGGTIGPVLGTWISQYKGASATLRSGDAREMPHEMGVSAISTPHLRGLTLLYLLTSMALGSVWMRLAEFWGFTFPVYFGAMLLGVIGRSCLGSRVDVGALEEASSHILSLFVSMAMMTLQWGRLRGMYGSLAFLFGIQLLALIGMTLFLGCYWGKGGRRGAFFGAGFFGFMMGTTANALSNMQSLAKKMGHFRQAFLIVPLVGACFVDFVNAALISFCLRFF